MIARCGLATRVLDARSRAGLAGPAHPLRRGQGRRDPHSATRSRRAAPHQPPTNPHLARPRRAQRPEQTAARAAAADAAGLTPHVAALAPPARRPTLDLPAPTTRPTTHATADPGPRAEDGPRESPMGLPTHTRRAGRPRPHRRRLHRLEDHERRRARSPHPDGLARPGASSCPPKPTPSSLSTSPTSTPSSYAASTSSS
jgi:hypothetical protein